MVLRGYDNLIDMISFLQVGWIGQAEFLGLGLGVFYIIYNVTVTVRRRRHRSWQGRNGSICWWNSFYTRDGVVIHRKYLCCAGYVKF